jgi:hypothetical protein
MYNALADTTYCVSFGIVFWAIVIIVSGTWKLVKWEVALFSAAFTYVTMFIIFTIAGGNIG